MAAQMGLQQPNSSGMSLRDYFAAAALQGLLSSMANYPQSATQAYEIADAMLAEREK
jgi:D-alanyl-D-alanine carboxypeptidase